MQTLTKYQNGKIYKIVSSHTNKIYIGSTISTLLRRFYGHKKNYDNKKKCCSSSEILKYDDAKIVLIENYPTTSRFFLELREGMWILQLNCVNENVPKRKYQSMDIKHIIDPTIDDYKNGVIYKLVSNHTADIYIGSTKCSLNTRFKEHKYNYEKSYYTTAFEILKYNDVKIELIEKYPSTSREALESRERYWIQSLSNCVNKVIPTRTDKEYVSDNADKISKYAKIYYEKNKDKIKEKTKIYRNNNKDKINEDQKKYTQKNKEKINNKGRKRYHENVEVQRQRSQKYHQDHKMECRARSKKNYYKNKEKIENKDKIKECTSKSKNVQNKQQVECEICKKILLKKSLQRHIKTQHKV